MNRQYFNDAVCAIVVYDVTDSESMTNATKWLALIDNFCPGDTLKVLCGNKVDRIEDKAVSSHRAEMFASEYEFAHWFEISAKDGTNLN